MFFKFLDCQLLTPSLPLLLFHSCLLYSFPSYKEASLPLLLVERLFNPDLYRTWKMNFIQSRVAQEYWTYHARRHKKERFFPKRREAHRIPERNVCLVTFQFISMKLTPPLFLDGSLVCPGCPKRTLFGNIGKDLETFAWKLTPIP